MNFYDAGAGRVLEAVESVADCRVEELERADVEPHAADQREHAYFEDDQQGYFDDYVAEADDFARSVKCGERHGCVEADQEDRQQDVADDCCDQAFEVGLFDDVVEF